ncbi:uncharacterized protein LOC120348387 [Styela clava]
MEAKSINADQSPVKIGFAKGCYGYKMSKKVAELTQVVHMLFTRNHEREVELDELRDAYEQEITAVIQDARSKIERLEYQLRESERKRKKESDEVSLNISNLLREAQERMDSLKNDLHEEKKESTHLRDLLTQAHKDLEILKHGSTGVTGDLQKKSKILEEKEKEFQKMWHSYTELESRYISNSKHTEDLKKQLELAHDTERRNKLHTEKMLKAVEEKKRFSQELAKKLKSYEEEVKVLKRELNKKTKEGSKDSRLDAELKDSENYDKDERKFWKDVEKLRRENEWLRNEIKNREGNFNRVFANFHPVFVGSSSHQQPHSDILQDRDMMMVTPVSSFPSHNKTSYPPLLSSPQNSGNVSARRRTPNLTGLEPKVHSMAPTPTPLRPRTKDESRWRESHEMNGGKQGKHFRLVFTK